MFSERARRRALAAVVSPWPAHRHALRRVQLHVPTAGFRTAAGVHLLETARRLWPEAPGWRASDQAASYRPAVRQRPCATPDAGETDDAIIAGWDTRR
jgi:uncharacterized protein YfaP (DUF2135 family)